MTEARTCSELARGYGGMLAEFHPPLALPTRSCDDYSFQQPNIDERHR
jgi:hypothetical protein